jgi:peroxiredoxin
MSATMTNRASRELFPRWLPALLALGVGAGGLALHLLSPVVAVVATLGGWFVAAHAVAKSNRSGVRLAAVSCGLLHAAAVQLNTGSWLLAGAVAIATLGPIPYELTVRPLGYRAWGWQPPLSSVVAALLLAAAWPLDSRAWSVAPTMVVSTLLVIRMLPPFVLLARQARPRWRVEVGQPVPNFQLKQRGSAEMFDLTAERGRYVLLALMIGDWCPICQVHLRIYGREAPRLAKRGVKLVAISPSAGPEAEAFAREMGLDFALLEDPDNRVARLLGALDFQGHHGQETPLPVSFLVGPDGTLRYASRPDDVVAFLDPRKVIQLLEQELATVS